MELTIRNFTNDGKDIEFVFKRIPSGEWKVIYRLDQRWVKNNRDPEITVYKSYLSHL